MHLLLLGLAVACRDASTAPPATLTIQKAPANSGDLQIDTVLATIAPLHVLVSAGGAAAGGVKVFWTVSVDTVVATPSAITDPSGIASLTLTFGARPAVYAVRARLASDTLGPGVAFSATATAGPPMGFHVVSGADQIDTATATLGTDYVIQVTDGHGNGVVGVPIEWDVTAGGGTITPARGATVGPNGFATARHTLGRRVGENAATATVLPLNDNVEFRAMGIVAKPTMLSLMSGDQQSGQTNLPLSADLVVAVTDSYGNGAAGVVIDWAVAAGGGALSSSQNTTGPDGAAAIRATLGPTAGTQRVTATASGLAAAPAVTFTATAVAPTPAPAPPPESPPPAPPPGSPPPAPPPPPGPALRLLSAYNPLEDDGWWDGFYLAIGQYHSATVARRSSDVTLPLTVALTHSGASISMPSSVVIPAGSIAADFRITGMSLGGEDVTASAPGYSPATHTAYIERGSIALFTDIGGGVTANWVPPVKVLDSLSITLAIGDVLNDSIDGLLAAATTFTLSTNGNVQFVSGGASSAAIGSITIPANQNTVHLWLKGFSAGVGTVTITSANYQTFNVNVTVSP